MITCFLYLNNPNYRRFVVEEIFEGKKNSRVKRIFLYRDFSSAMAEEIIKSPEPMIYFKDTY